MKEYRRSIVLFQIMNFFYWCAIFSYTPTLSTYAKSIGASSWMIGLIMGGYGITQMLLRLPLGLLSDRTRRRKVFVSFGMLMVGLAGLISALFPTAWGLFAARCVTGIGASAWVNCLVLFPTYYPPEKTGQAVSWLNTGHSIAVCSSMVLGGWVVQLWDQRAVGFVAGACGLIAFLLSLGIADHRPEPKHPLTMGDIKYVLSDQRLWFFSLMSLVYNFVWTGTANCFTPILAERFGVSSNQLGYLNAIGAVGQLVSAAVLGIHLLPRLKIGTVFCGGFLLLGIMVAATAFATGYWMLLLLMFLAGMIGFSIHLCVLTNCVKEMPDELRGIAMGMAQAIYGIGMFIGPSGLGQLLEFVSLEQGYLMIGALCLVTAFVGSQWSRKLDHTSHI